MLHKSDSGNFVDVKIANEVFCEVQRNLPVLNAQSVSEVAERVLMDYLDSEGLRFKSRGLDDGK
jgi:hypothetical protein